MRTMLIALLCLLFAGCASLPKEQDDPLQYTRKLVKEGHASLYNNGAFQVPRTEIRPVRTHWSWPAS